MRPDSTEPGASPNRLSEPCVGFRTWAAMFSNVVLPAPLGPTSPQILPAGSRKVQSRSAQPRR